MPIVALTAQANVARLVEQARALRPKLAVIGDEKLYLQLKSGLQGTSVECGAGRDAVIAAAVRPSDVVMVAIMGAAAIEPALAAIRRGATVALANKNCRGGRGRLSPGADEIGCRSDSHRLRAQRRIPGAQRR